MTDAQLIPPGGVNRIPAFDPRTGDHYWIFPVCFHITDPAVLFDQRDGPALMDRENLVLADVVGCFHCEEPYSARVAARRCKGHS